jgi:hypothetical protein
MVSHDINVEGVSLLGRPVGEPRHPQLRFVAQSKPALLQLNNEDFPARFLSDLAARKPTPGSSLTALSTSPATPVTLFQPVHRILNVALLQLTCDTLNQPRLDPKRVESAGLVIRRVVRTGVPDRPDLPPMDRLDLPASAWMRSTDGQFQWVALSNVQELEDPDPAQRPQLYSGQPELDRLLKLQTLSSAKAEVFTPAFVAAPAVCEAAGRTLVYAVIPTASSDVTTVPPPSPQYDLQTLSKSLLPTLLRRGKHDAPMADQQVDYHFMSDDYAKAHSGDTFPKFSLTLRMLYTVFGAFDDNAQAQSLIAALNQHNVYFPTTVDGSPALLPLAMGTFYQQAAQALIDYDPAGGGPVPWLTMPHAWDGFSGEDHTEIVAKIAPLLQLRSAQVTAPMGRYQDASRLYRLRVFLRIKSEVPGCPAKLVWSKPSDPFRIAAWHECAGRTQPPVSLPDPTDPNFRKNAKPNCSFAVPAGLMNGIQGSSLSGLTAGSGPAPGGVQLNWICGFSIPLITICAFFVLNIFLTLLNLVFFWLPFIKICIPFPAPTPANSGDADGT